MDKGFQIFVRQRAGEACEYCRLPEACTVMPFHLDHIIAEQHDGRTVHDNIALACAHCNRYKGPNLAGIDPESNRIVPLFHPRRDVWEDHFAWQGSHLAGLTSMGRATIRLLQINRPMAVAFRDVLMKEGTFFSQAVSVHEPRVVYRALA